MIAQPHPLLVVGASGPKRSTWLFQKTWKTHRDFASSLHDKQRDDEALDLTAVTPSQDSVSIHSPATLLCLQRGTAMHAMDSKIHVCTTHLFMMACDGT